MNFEEARISGGNYLNPEAIYSLIVRDLCGEQYHRTFSEVDQRHISDFLTMASREGLTYERFNELLLLLEQDRVSKAFYKFFFSEADVLPLAALPSKVIRFRGFAMLCYGDFRFAYKDLSRKNEDEIYSSLRPFCRLTADIEKRFKVRPRGALNIERIAKEDTWCLGYIAGRKHDKEAALLADMLKEKPSDGELMELATSYAKLGARIEETHARGLRNTDVYLTWDFMDVYVATSMRRRWEYEDVAEFVIQLFSDSRLGALKLRYFDPTQSDCRSRIDKGLVEALMLKRALCTVYMVQESDTLGKDSELASTLAQGKPVIAYVPMLDVANHARKIRDYPLEFFKSRFRILQAEGAFEDPDLQKELSAITPEYVPTVDSFFEEIKKFTASQPLSFYEGKETEFKKGFKSFETVCKLLAAAERYNCEKRATILRNVHPLSLQVHLESGVANGVLVVRTVAECAEVLTRLLTNALTFIIDLDSKERCTVLREKISQSPFRAVTQYEKLANSFWNFYLMDEQQN
jgi:hypothetical protein